MSASEPPFRFRHPVTVRFRDTDVGGHVHHAQALVYMEEGRWAYWRAAAGREGIDSVDYIMAEAGLRWHRRTLYPGEVEVGVRTVSVGRKHFELAYEIRDGESELLVSGRTTQVMYDYGRLASVRVTDELRARLEAFEGRPLPARRG